MLLEDFDNNKNAIINASTFYEKVDNFPETCVSIFSRKIVKEIIETYNPARSLMIDEPQSLTIKLFH